MYPKHIHYSKIQVTMPNKWAKKHAVVRIMMVNSPTYLKPYDQ
jgi:hypothetical protein